MGGFFISKFNIASPVRYARVVVQYFFE